MKLRARDGMKKAFTQQKYEIQHYTHKHTHTYNGKQSRKERKLNLYV